MLRNLRSRKKKWSFLNGDLPPFFREYLRDQQFLINKLERRVRDLTLMVSFLREKVTVKAKPLIQGSPLFVYAPTVYAILSILHRIILLAGVVGSGCFYVIYKLFFFKLFAISICKSLLFLAFGFHLFYLNPILVLSLLLLIVCPSFLLLVGLILGWAFLVVCTS